MSVHARRNTHCRREMNVLPCERKGRGPGHPSGSLTVQMALPPSARERPSFNTVQHAALDCSMKEDAREGPLLGKNGPR
jgi:hypothetical protein